MKKVEMDSIFHAIRRERMYQDRKWGSLRSAERAVSHYLATMERILLDDLPEKGKTLEDVSREILQIISVGVACLEEHGVFERDYSVQPGDENEIDEML